MVKLISDSEILQAALAGLEHQKAEIDGKRADIRRRLLGNQKGAPAEAASANSTPERKPMSAAARKRIRAATRKRWAAYRKSQGK